MKYAIVILLFVSPILASKRAEEYIVNGQAASTNEWPWQGGWLSGGSFSCGCVLMHRLWVLTAGHCVGGAANGYTMEFGAIRRGQGTIHSNTGVTRHPNYDSGPAGVAVPNDICVVGVSGITLDVDTAIVPGGMDTGISRVSQTCFITGWGRTCGGCGISDVLMEVQIPVISDASCESFWGASHDPQYHICVYDGVGSSCNGDSGGPLVCRASTGDSWDLVGLTSWGNAGCNPNEPSVYTRVSSYTAWVCTNTGGDVC